MYYLESIPAIIPEKPGSHNREVSYWIGLNLSLAVWSCLAPCGNPRVLKQSLWTSRFTDPVRCGGASHGFGSAEPESEIQTESPVKLSPQAGRNL